MLSFTFLSACIGIVAAFPAPQDIDFDLAYALPNPTFTEAVGATAQTVTYNPTTVFSAALSQVTASDPTDTPVAASVAAEKRAAACATQPSGYGPIPSPDSASAFVSYSAFASSASAAPVPSGYTQQFQNLQSSNNAYGYMGYTTLQTYDVNTCAAKCNAMNGCISINIYFERDPSVDPGSGSSGCTNPPSTTVIKCVFWGGPVSASNAVNSGQWRNQFQVVIAGSNGYTNNSVASVPGYSSATPLGNAAINAPYDTYGYNSYMGNAIFIGAFNAALCAQACTTKSNYNLAHPPTDGSPVQTCQFFNTYILYINTTSQVQGQYCAMYSESWPASYATNVGQYRGKDHFLIQYSFSYSNSTNPGQAQPLPAVYQARNDITYSSLQPYCSSILGYTIPTVTATAASTTTPIVFTTTTSTVTPYTYTATALTTLTTTQTLTAGAVVTVIAKRDETSSSVSRNIITVATSDYPNRLLPTELLTATDANNKRAAPTSAVLTMYPSSIIASACSLVASRATTTVTVTMSTITTAPAATSTATTYLSTTPSVTTTIATTITVSTTVTTTSTYTSHTPTSSPTAVVGFNDDKNHCGCSYSEYPGEYSGFYCTFSGGIDLSFNACAERCDFFGNCYGFSNGPDECMLCSGNPSGFDGNAANEFSSSRLYGSCKDGSCQPPKGWGQGN